jgi:hypothetical protein
MFRYALWLFWKLELVDVVWNRKFFVNGEKVEVNGLEYCLNRKLTRKVKFSSVENSPSTLSSTRDRDFNVIAIFEFTTSNFTEQNLVEKLEQVDRQLRAISTYYKYNDAATKSSSTSPLFAESLYWVLYFE